MNLNQDEKLKPEELEKRLISRIRVGDPQAERQLYDAHVDRVYRLAYRLSGDAALAEDLTQDIFIRVFDRLDDFRGDGAFGGWLHRIATSVIFSGLRQRKRRQDRESIRDDLSGFQHATREADPDLKRHIDQAVASLDDNQRLVFVMHDMEGFTHQEIAAAMDSPVGTAKARLSRARARLRELLEGKLGPGPDMRLE
jgi:RNA polymerase sigma-70 factor (ECF subfamily)